MRRILENLMRVQETDTAIRALEERVSREPQERASIESEAAAAERDLAGTRERRQALEKGRKELEQLVEDANLAVKKHQRQAYEVKTNKEYTAMLHEIEGEKRRVSELEERILAMMEEAESLASEESQAVLKAKEARRAADEKLAGLQARTREAEAELAQASAGKKALLDDLPPDVLAVYRRISKGRNGLAVVPMVGGACGGCYANLPTRLTVEIKSMEELITCEACGRILVWKPAERDGPMGGNATKEHSGEKADG